MLPTRPPTSERAATLGASSDATGLAAAAVPADSQRGLLDEASLQRLRDLDPSGGNRLLERVTDAFETSTRRLLPQLETALGAMDFDGVKHVAHTLKSSSASIGALSLSALCADIEGMIRSRDTGDLAERVAQMRSEITAVNASLRALLNNTA